MRRTLLLSLGQVLLLLAQGIPSGSFRADGHRPKIIAVGTCASAQLNPIIRLAEKVRYVSLMVTEELYSYNGDRRWLRQVDRKL